MRAGVDAVNVHLSESLASRPAAWYYPFPADHAVKSYVKVRAAFVCGIHKRVIYWATRRRPPSHPVAKTSPNVLRHDLKHSPAATDAGSVASGLGRAVQCTSPVSNQTGKRVRPIGLALEAINNALCVA